MTKSVLLPEGVNGITSRNKIPSKAKRMTPDSQRLKAVAERYTQALRRTFQEDLVSVVLFGSVGRGEASPESDIDLLIVLRNLPPGRLARAERLEGVEARGGFEEVPIRRILKTPEETSRIVPLYLDLVEDGVLLYDVDHFFRRILSSLRRRLNALGAKRLKLGSVRYWDLKPDLKPGEVFEI
jgi:predicted nucleotidyltransferase